MMNRKYDYSTFTGGGIFTKWRIDSDIWPGKYRRRVHTDAMNPSHFHVQSRTMLNLLNG